MPTLAQFFGTAQNLVLVILGFGLIIFLHELGHFLAARWAGIRTLAFAVGFGPALFSYRKGMGFQVGSSESRYTEMLRADAAGATTIEGRGSTYHSVSSTEYRFNILPLGGYVKMLGQDDLNPLATSDAPDSYQNCKPWKRMVVISAGVIVNVITAVVLFILVFMVGLKTEPAKVGGVQPGSPAATCVATNAKATGVTEPGLRPGDELILVDGRKPNSFNDLVLATAMSERDHALSVTVRRPGVSTPLQFSIRPTTGAQSGLLELGVEPSRSGHIPPALTEAVRAEFTELMTKANLEGVEPGMHLVRVGDRAGGDSDLPDGNMLAEAIRQSGGKPVPAQFASDSGKQVAVSINARPQMMVDFAPRSDGMMTPVEHLLGITPVMSVAQPETPSKDDMAVKAGLMYGDLFARIGNTEFPNAAQGMAEIKGHRSGSVDMVVLRKDHGALKEVKLSKVPVSRKGQVGFLISRKSDQGLLVSLPPTLRHPGAAENFTPSASKVILSPGTRILSAASTPVADMPELRAALLAATDEAAARREGAVVTLTVQRPLHGPDGITWDTSPVESFEWPISADDVASLHALAWESPEVSIPFEPESAVRVAKNPVQAVEMGLAETRRVMLTTYITFARLAEGTVKVEHLKGPVGIAHLGTLVADRGFIWLLFFMALISINLAVINFLPLPIVDGGQFLFLVYEQIRGKPVPPGFQNAVTMAGLVLIGCVFLVVTYNDITNLLGL